MGSKIGSIDLLKSPEFHFSCRVDVFQTTNSKYLGFYLIDQVSEEMLLEYYPSMTGDTAKEIVLETVLLFEPWMPIDIESYLSEFTFEVSFSNRPKNYTLQEWWESGTSPFSNS